MTFGQAAHPSSLIQTCFSMHSREQSLLRFRPVPNFKHVCFLFQLIQMLILLKSSAEMGPKHRNGLNERGILISWLEKTCSRVFKEYLQNFCEPFSLPQSFYLSFKDTFTEDLLIETFYWVHLIAPYFRNNVGMEKSLSLGSIILHSCCQHGVIKNQYYL